MDQLWKWVMHLNAKAFCLGALLFLFGVCLWSGWLIKHPHEPLKDGLRAKVPELAPAWEIGTLNFVSNQLANETLSIPIDPFRPTIESILTNETERTAFLKALKAAQKAAAGIAPGEAAQQKKEDPFAHLRKKTAAPGVLVGPNGRPMVIPKLSFLGFFQRPDGSRAAMFHDSVNNTTLFYDAGKQAVHGVEILSANVHEAEIRFPNGTTRKLEIGSNVELAPEPAKTPPPAAKKAAPAKKAAAAVKPGAAQKAAAQKAAAKKAAQQKAAVQKAARQKAAAQKQKE